MAGFDYLIKSTTIVQEIIEQNAKDAKNGVKKQQKRPNSELRQNEGDGKELWKRPASAQKRAQRPGSAMVRKKPIEESESVKKIIQEDQEDVYAIKENIQNMELNFKKTVEQKKQRSNSSMAQIQEKLNKIKEERKNLNSNTSEILTKMSNYQSNGPVKAIREPYHDVEDQKRKLEGLLRNNSEMKQKLKIKVVASRERLASIDHGENKQHVLIKSKLNSSMIDQSQPINFHHINTE